LQSGLEHILIDFIHKNTMKLYSGKPEKAKAKHVFKNNDYYAGVYVRRETPSLQRSIGHQWKQVKLKKSQRISAQRRKA
jgi:hypothetical protein